MTDFAAWLHGRTRRVGLAAALVGAAMFLAPGASMPSAEAKTARADLALGSGGAGSGAQGRIQFKQQRRGERLKLRLDNLLPRTDYEVRDGATADVLGTVRTNRRGSAKKTLRAGSDRSLSGVLLEICEPGSDDPVLEGQVPGDDSGMPWFDGTYKVGTVSTDPEASVQVSISLSSITSHFTPGDPTGVDPSRGDPVPGEPVQEETYESISLFAGPGGVWIMEEGANGGIPELPSIPGPVTFWVVDGENGLVKVATIEKDDWGKPIPLPEPGTDTNGPGSTALRRGRHHRGPRGGQALMGKGMGMPASGMPWFDGGPVTIGVGSDGDPGTGGWGDGVIYPQPDFFSWSADNMTEPGLPFGVTSVSDLSGRSFEVRDGEGTVLLDGVLPALEEIVFEPLPDPLPGPDFPCPWGDININIDFSGFDWSSVDFSSIDWGSIDLGSLLGGDAKGFDFSKMLQGFKF